MLRSNIELPVLTMKVGIFPHVPSVNAKAEYKDRRFELLKLFHRSCRIGPVVMTAVDENE
jgi:hypothetical protein